VLLILVALGLAVFGTIQFTRSMERSQRVVTWLVVGLVVGLILVKLIQLGVLGRATATAP
jgi:hypothetical protein